MRGYFQKYLTNNFTEETLLFWEYAEDYWRAHPYSSGTIALHSKVRRNSNNMLLASSSARSITAAENFQELQQQDRVMLASATVVRQWAESIFLTFVHYNAPYQIGSCTARDIARIDTTLEELPRTELPPHNLFRSVQLATFEFMKTQCFPDFVRHPQYHRALAAAVHAEDRVS